MVAVLQIYYLSAHTNKQDTLMKKFRIIVLLLTLLFVASANATIGSLTQFTVAAVQLQTIDVGNFNKMRTLVKEAKAHGADLVIFPEESVFSWLNPDVFLEAAPIPGKYSNEFAAIAKDESIWLAAGLGEQGPEANTGAQHGAHQAYDSGILINPDGQIVLHHRQFNVVKNAFDPCACQQILNQTQCSYTAGELSDITTVITPFGKTAILVCADAYIYPPAQPLSTLKQLQPDFVIILWGITASTHCECGMQGFNATTYAVEAAMYLNAFVVGANAIGTRSYGRFLPSEYCGASGYATPIGQGTDITQLSEELVLFRINKL